MADQIRSSKRWKVFRLWIIKRYPLCFDPFLDHKQWGIIVAAEQVHHIIPLTIKPGLAFTESNVATLCFKCHGKVEGMIKLKKETEHLFKKITTISPMEKGGGGS